MSTSDLHFAHEQEPQAEPYRPLSGLAIIALLLGLLSPLGIASAFLLVVPVAGALVSLAALRRINASEGELSGARLAVVALVVSCFFGAWAAGQNISRWWLISTQARRFCDDWLDLMVEGKTLEAFQWTRHPSERVAPHVALDAFLSRNSETAQSLEMFLAGLPFSADRHGSSLRAFRFLNNRSVTTEGGISTIVQRYEIVYMREQQEQKQVVWVTVLRLPPTEKGFVHWQLQDVRIEQAPGSRPY